MVNTSFIVIDGEGNGLLALICLDCSANTHIHSHPTHTHPQSCLITHIVYISGGAAEVCQTCFITLSHFDECVGAVCIQQLLAVIRLFHLNISPSEKLKMEYVSSFCDFPCQKNSFFFFFVSFVVCFSVP